MSFGWSVGDIVAGLQLLNKVRIALKDSGGSKSEYQDEIDFLDNLSSIMQTLRNVQPESLQPELAGSISGHAERIRNAIDHFRQDLQSEFGQDLGRFPKRRSVLGAAVPALRKLQWVSTSKKVQVLRDRIGSELLMLQIKLSQQMINICTQMPADIQCQIERVIKSTLHDYRRAHESLPRDGDAKSYRGDPAIEEHNMMHLNRVLRNLEDRASRITIEDNHIYNHEHSQDDLSRQDNEKRTQSDSQLNKVSETLQRLEQLQVRFEACSLLRDPPIPSESVTFVKVGRMKSRSSETREISLQGVEQFLNNTLYVLRTLIHVITLTVIAGYSRLVMPLFSHIAVLRIGISSENGLRLIDALGRGYNLPYGSGQSWKTVQRTLEIWFEDCPGQDLVQKGLYCLGDPRRPNEFVTEESWAHFVQNCSAVKMWMVLDKCQSCGRRMTCKGATQTVFCEDCHNPLPLISHRSFRQDSKGYYPSTEESQESATLRKLSAASLKTAEDMSTENELLYEALLQLRALKHVLYYVHSSGNKKSFHPKITANTQQTAEDGTIRCEHCNAKFILGKNGRRGQASNLRKHKYSFHPETIRN